MLKQLLSLTIALLFLSPTYPVEGRRIVPQSSTIRKAFKPAKRTTVPLPSHMRNWRPTKYDSMNWRQRFQHNNRDGFNWSRKR